MMPEPEGVVIEIVSTTESGGVRVSGVFDVVSETLPPDVAHAARERFRTEDGDDRIRRAIERAICLAITANARD
jgi:hypothetical protein